MAKPSLLFVDHEFHKKTKSFQFLTSILEKEFAVSTLYVDADRPIDWEALKTPHEYVVIGQMDFLAPFFISQGKKVVVVPMYDGSSGMPLDHWKLARQARYLNFSTFMHAQALSAECESLFVQYFPEPTKNQMPKEFKTLRAFFWQRRPEQWLNIKYVLRLLGSQVDTLHVHTPSDTGEPFDRSSLRRAKCKVTTSEWFDTAEEFREIIDGCNIFVAPRLAEGIGHAFLEAMARGAIILANDQATHNEYITNWSNGILISEDLQSISFDREGISLMDISANAIETARLKHQLWKKSIPDILKFIRQTPAGEMPGEKQVSTMVKRLAGAYQNGVGPYFEALNKSSFDIALLASWRDFIKTEDSSPREDSTTDGRCVEIVFGSGNSTEFTVSGWAPPESTHQWTLKRRATLDIPWQGDAKFSGIEIDLRGLGENEVEVRLNDEHVGSINIDDTMQLHRITFDKILRFKKVANVTIELAALRAPRRPPKGENRSLVIGLRTIRLLLSK